MAATSLDQFVNGAATQLGSQLGDQILGSVNTYSS